MGELAQLGRRLLGVVERLGQEGGGILPFVLAGAAGKLQRDDRVDQPLLRAVVEIANHPAALLVGGRHDPRTGRRQLGPRLGVRDRRRDQLGEVLQARLGVRRSDPPSGDVATMTPQSRPSTTIGAPTAERFPMLRT